MELGQPLGVHSQFAKMPAVSKTHISPVALKTSAASTVISSVPEAVSFKQILTVQGLTPHSTSWTKMYALYPNQGVGNTSRSGRAITVRNVYFSAVPRTVDSGAVLRIVIARIKRGFNEVSGPDVPENLVFTYPTAGPPVPACYGINGTPVYDVLDDKLVTLTPTARDLTAGLADQRCYVKSSIDVSDVVTFQTADGADSTNYTYVAFLASTADCDVEAVFGLIFEDI